VKLRPARFAGLAVEPVPKESPCYRARRRRRDPPRKALAGYL